MKLQAHQQIHGRERERETRRRLVVLVIAAISDSSQFSTKMMTMGDEGERTCPLCAEEMDFTDQQLKPCKCGYEICVWCWHHIIEMAEKDGTEGRCPACRLPYDKERIVGAATNHERVVSESNGDRKQKFQKGKPRVSAEARKQLGSVRVIQRNLVYIIGLPLSLANESMLEHREYFGQYGKVLKVSISRPSVGSQQASNSNTFSVYITYAKEEEAVRCIQAVHNFVLDGKPLRACFGTTKYCHAWLRNMPCSNADCFYLHDIGSQESFSKDEIISAYSRSRVPQIIANNLQRRSGSTLPPPIDDFCNNGTTSNKNLVKSSSYSSPSHAKYSHTSIVNTRSTLLPASASWGSRTSHPISSSMPCLQGPSKQILTDTCHTLDVSPETYNIDPIYAWDDDVAKQGKFHEGHMDFIDTRSKHLESSKPSKNSGSRTAVDEFDFSCQSSAWHDDTGSAVSLEESHKTILSNKLIPTEPSQPGRGGDFERMLNSTVEIADVDQVAHAWDDDDYVVAAPSICKINDAVLPSDGYKSIESLEAATNKAIGISVSEIPGEALLDPICYGTGANSTSSPGTIENIEENNTLQHENGCSEDIHTFSNAVHETVKGITTINQNVEGLCNELSSVNVDDHLFCVNIDEHQGSSLNNTSFKSRVPEGPYLEKHFEDITASKILKSPTLFQNHISRESSGWTSELWRHFSAYNGKKNADALEAPNNQSYSGSSIGEQLHPSGLSSFMENTCSTTCSPKDIRITGRNSTTSWLSVNNNIFPDTHQDSSFSSPSEQSTHSAKKGICLGIDEFSSTKKDIIADTRESNIISDILLMDFDPWDTSLTAGSNILKLLQADTENSSQKISSSLKGQNSSQSRFSFARQENESSLPKSVLHVREKSQNDGIGQDHLGPLQNGFAGLHAESQILLNHVQPVTQSNKNHVAIPRAKVSAPPGFSVPYRSPPPGFSSQDRLLQACDIMSSGSSTLQNHYDVPHPNATDDLELIDPAILVCKASGQNTGFGSRSFPTDANASGNDLMYQLLTQQNISRQKAQLLSSQAGDGFVPMNDAYYPKQFTVQNYSNISHLGQMPNQSSQWIGWNERQDRKDLETLEILKLHGLAKYFPGNEQQIFQPGNLYNRSFGI